MSSCFPPNQGIGVARSARREAFKSGLCARLCSWTTTRLSSTVTAADTSSK